ncbi:MAG: CDP-diacylglycerol--serine O-phosphatidyltransferase [Mariprofundaceae bacterium]|nr:CDP-diacylglycerol--serine O-phosphatidyltransferase [Mariprofundaceae bacterium]
MTTTVEQQPVRKTRRRGIYVLPSVFTILGLLCGFYALIGAIQGDYANAAWAIVAAAVFDMLDGRVARMLDAETAFGAELDSLCDMLSFGVAPAVLVYLWALTSYGKLGWLAAFLIVACSALRLARFNVQLASQDKRYFQGLPTPALALMIASSVLFHDVLALQPVGSLWLVASMVLAWLLVSNVRFVSGKDIDLKKQRRFAVITMLLAVIVMLTAYPELMLFTVFFLYCVHGPVLSVWQGQKAARARLLKRKQRAQQNPQGAEDE